MAQSKIALLPVRTRESFEPKSPQQLGLWPLKATREYPPEDGAGAHYAGKVVAEDGVAYYVKTAESGRHIPFTEMCAHELCRSLNIASPPCDRIELTSKLIAFGSRAETDSEDGSALAARLAEDEAVIHTFGTQISRLAALDAFLANTDRSFRNLRWRPADIQESRPPISRHGAAGAVITLDFSRAFMTLGWPLPPPGFPPRCPSENFYRGLRNKGFFIGKETGFTLDRLTNLPRGFMEMVFTKCDPSWISAEEMELVMQWWGSVLRGIRIHETERYLKNDLKIPVLHS